MTRELETTCPDCSERFNYWPDILHLTFDGKVECPNPDCAARFAPATATIRFAGNDSRVRSDSQERRAAKRYDARKQAGSGASWRAKGDLVDEGRLRGECKHTVGRSISVRLDDLLKLERESRGAEQPLFELEFQGVFPHKRYVVLSEGQYLTLIDDGRRDDDDEE